MNFYINYGGQVAVPGLSTKCWSANWMAGALTSIPTCQLKLCVAPAVPNSNRGTAFNVDRGASALVECNDGFEIAWYLLTTVVVN